MSTNRDPIKREIDLQLFGAHVGQLFVEQLRQATQTCLSCEHWQNDVEQCGKFNARPPARIIAFGCPDYSEAPPF